MSMASICFDNLTYDIHHFGHKHFYLQKTKTGQTVKMKNAYGTHM